MFSELQQPAYLHVLLNHLPIAGSAFGLLAVLAGLVLRRRAAVIPGLVILLAAGLLAWPVYETGSAAYKPIRKIADDAGADWLDEHMDRADRTVWAFHAMAVIAGVAIVAPWRWPKTAAPLAIASVLAAAACTGVGVYIADAGGRVRHPEFRPPGVAPPAGEEAPHTHEH